MSRICPLVCAIAVAAAALPADAQSAAIVWERHRFPLGRDTVDAELGRLTLPEDHAAPNGPKITLALVRLSGTADRTRPPTIYLDGGPGSSGIATARLPHLAQLFTALREIGDVILVDQRGVGMSRPNLACPSRTSPPADLFATEEKFRRYLREGARACAARQRAAGVRLEHYTTEASADDIAGAIRALGARQANLFGFSYGTHLGLAVIRRHASLVHRAVLAGVEGPDHSEKWPSVSDVQLQRLALHAREDPSIGALAADLVGTVRQVLQQLERQPARVTLTDPVTRQPTEVTIGRFGFQYILLRDLGDTNDWPVLPGLIVRTAQKDFGLLTQFAAKRWSSSVSAMSVAMDCASGGSPERVAQVTREAKTSLFGNAMNLYTGLVCSDIGAADLGAQFRARIWSAIPTMFISGTLDSQTPPHQAEEVRWGFPRSTHIVVENAGHESTLDKGDVQRLIVRYFAGEEVRDQRIVLPPVRFRAPGR